MSSREKDTSQRKELMWRADMSGEGRGGEKMGKKGSVLPEHLEKMRTKVACGVDCPTQTSTYAAASAFATSGFDNSFSFRDFKENFSFQIQSITNEEMIFDIVGIDPPIANALRRILLSEVPTLAFEQIYIKNNTSVIVDEVLAHRVGLLPLQVDPRPFLFQAKGEAPSDNNTVEFTLNVSCPKHEKEKRVYSGDMKWKPLGTQAIDYKDDPIRMVHDDVLLAILGPGQEISLVARAVKGIGLDHVKFSPVATAFYRLLPDVSIKDPFIDIDAEALVAKCPMRVFDIEDIGGTKQAVVRRPRNCTVCRECIRDPKWERRIEVSRFKTHYIFTIETTGALAPELIFHMAMLIFLEKLSVIRKSFHLLQTPK